MKKIIYMFSLLAFIFAGCDTMEDTYDELEEAGVYDYVISVDYTLTEDDYDAMGEDYGEPGYYDSFSSSTTPNDYLPAWIATKFAVLDVGSDVTITYDYYADYATTEKTIQYIYAEDGWYYDPSIFYTFTSDDYQTIVDYVSDNYGEDYLDSYGTAEYYYGANAYYEEFVTTSASYYNDEEFDSSDDAIIEAIGIWLPLTYPTAVTTVDGEDMYYVITYTGYNGSASTYTLTFQCTVSGTSSDDPATFEYKEGPTEE
jgi:hypothetical protein